MAKKNHTALTWITREAKKLRKEYPNRFSSWNEYVAQASAIYSRKHGGRSPIGKKKPMRKSSHPKRRKPASHRRKAGKTTGITTRSRTHTDYNRNKVNITVGAVNRHKKAAREKLLLLIGKEEAAKFKAPLKRVKKKLAKKISKYKADYRRLSS